MEESGGSAQQALENGRVAYGQRSWSEAFNLLSSVEAESGLVAADLELLATSAYMLGNVGGMLETQEKAYAAYIDEGAQLSAARVALWVAAGLAGRGKVTEAGGWLERGSRILDSIDGPCVEKGYLLLPQALRHAMKGEMEQAVAMTTDAAAIGRQFGDPDLIALASHSQARALLELGRTPNAFRLIDEVMLSVSAGECSPLITGIVYCSVLEGCSEAHEVRRASVWTDALTAWCGTQPDLVAFTDQCLAHRAEILRRRGDWAGALLEAQRSLDSRARGPVAAQVFYEQAEIYRMRGGFKQAEQAYQESALSGGEPQPGLALLQLQMGNEDVAVASVRRAMLETKGLLRRARILPGCVDVFLGAGHIEDARIAAEEMAAIAEETLIDMHKAWSAYSVGVVALTTRPPVEASSSLKEAMRIWEELDLPYELARARCALGIALAEMGDVDGSQLQLEAARNTFNDLDAGPDAARVAALLSPSGLQDPFGLTAREVEVLAKLASGETNRSIAGELVLSERTIDRHVSNIFTKLGVNTRAAATATAIRNHIV